MCDSVCLCKRDIHINKHMRIRVSLMCVCVWSAYGMLCVWEIN